MAPARPSCSAASRRSSTRAISPSSCNTGDDAEIWGLHVSPDLDTVCYALAGLIDERKGWGLRDETFHALEQMRALRRADLVQPRRPRPGHAPAPHAAPPRRAHADRGHRVASRRPSACGATVLPMSDQPVRTRILGPDGWLDFQEYFVRDKAQVEVREVAYAGADAARAGAGRARGASPPRMRCIVLPVESRSPRSGPILAVPGIARGARATRRRRRRGEPHRRWRRGVGPRGAAHGGRRRLPVSAAGVAQAYAPGSTSSCSTSGIGALAAEMRRLGRRRRLAPIIMTSREAEIALARCVARRDPRLCDGPSSRPCR